MMTDYTWATTTGFLPLPADHPEALGEGGIEPQMRAKGYASWDGETFALGQMEIWAQPEHPRFPYGCFVLLPGDRLLCVWIADDVTMLDFYRHYGSVGTLGRIQGLCDEMLTVLTKTFRGQHGHDAEGSCLRCDPEGYGRAQETLRKIAATKAGEKERGT